MGAEEVKAIIKDFSVEDRRKVAMYILELEKEHVQKAIGPQIADDLESVSKIFQEALEKARKKVC